MKTIFRRTALILGLVGLSVAASAEPILVDFDPATQTVELSDQVSVDIVVDPDGNLIGAYDFILGFDDSILSVADVVFGAALGGVADSLQVAVDLGFGMLNLAELSLLPSVDPFGPDLESLQPGPFTLATITFDTIGLGISALDLSPGIIGFVFPFGLFGDDFGFPLDVEVTGGSITVIEKPVAVPEPATWMLMLLGLAALTMSRRRITD